MNTKPYASADDADVFSCYKRDQNKISREDRQRLERSLIKNGWSRSFFTSITDSQA
jgi:hypothetical protein